MDLSIPCVRCGRPAAEHGEHHHPRRGMGGQGPKVTEHPRVPLCRGCHRDLHDGRFRLELNGPIAYCLAPDGAVLSVRAVRPQPLVHAFEAPAPDLAALAHQALLLDDESLAYVWETGETWRGTGDVVQAIVAWAMRQRYGSFGEAWYRRAAEILSEYSGLRVSVGTVYQRAALATALEACGWTLEPIHDLGKTVVAEAGKHDEPARALELAAALRDEGKRAAEVIRELRRSRHEDEVTEANFSNFEKCGHPRTYTIVRCAVCGEELEG